MFSGGKECFFRCYLSDSFLEFKAKAASLLGLEGEFVLVNKSSYNNLVLDNVSLNKKTGEVLSVRSLRLSKGMNIMAIPGDGTQKIENTDPVDQDINVICDFEGAAQTLVFRYTLTRSKSPKNVQRAFRNLA